VSEEVVVRNGLSVLIRPVSPDDKGRIRQAFEGLSPETRYRRFFAPLQALSSQDLRYLTEVDHHDHEALVAVNPENATIIGVARYVRSEDPQEAEVAVVVGDPWQEHGVATTLLERLVERAREEGIERFVALVMSENEDAIEFFRHLAPGGTTRRSASGYTELLIELPEPGGLRDSTLGRALRLAARGIRINPWGVLRERIGRRS
jgi:RimJ/RimL family protein N-acetyltransferase